MFHKRLKPLFFVPLFLLFAVIKLLGANQHRTRFAQFGSHVRALNLRQGHAVRFIVNEHELHETPPTFHTPPHPAQLSICKTPHCLEELLARGARSHGFTCFNYTLQSCESGVYPQRFFPISYCVEFFQGFRALHLFMRRTRLDNTRIASSMAVN